MSRRTLLLSVALPCVALASLGAAPSAPPNALHFAISPVVRADSLVALACEVSFAGAHGFVAFDRSASFRWPWQRVTTVELCNPERAPEALALGEAGRLPYAPWSGTLAQPDLAAPAELPIDGELDLHNFSPKEVDPLVRAYIDECLARGIFQLRIVHGKGIGALRRTVQAILSRHPAVESQRLGGHGEGSWGATIVTLRSPVKTR